MPFPSSGYLHKPGIKPISPALAGRFFTQPPGKPTMDYFSAIKKNEMLPSTATRMDMEGIMLSEISQTEKNKYCMVSLICRIKKKKKLVNITKKGLLK